MSPEDEERCRDFWLARRVSITPQRALLYKLSAGNVSNDLLRASRIKQHASQLKRLARVGGCVSTGIGHPPQGQACKCSALKTKTSDKKKPRKAQASLVREDLV